jgi:hypothetical protein
VCFTLIIGCGGGGGNSGPNLSGNWQATLLNPKTGSSKSESGFLVQSGNALAGSVLLTGQTNCIGVGSAQGQVSGSNVTITVDQVGQTLGFTGTTSDEGTKMSGSYQLLASPCGSTQVGTWTAAQVTALTGSLQSTFTSTKTVGLVFHFSGSITQGPNTGGSATTLAGSMTSTDAPCISAVSLGGQISGTTVVFNLLTSEGLAVGQLAGTTTTDATSITGTYGLSPQSPQLSNGCKDFGTVTVSVQPSA